MSFRLEYWEFTWSCELANGNNFSNDLPKTRRSAQTPTIPVLQKVLAAYPQTKDAQPEGDPPTKVISEGRGDSKHHQTD